MMNSNKNKSPLSPRLGPALSGADKGLSASHKAARRALAIAMIELGRAKDPARVFRENQDIIMTSLILLGRGEEAKALAATYGVTSSLPHKADV